MLINSRSSFHYVDNYVTYGGMRLHNSLADSCCCPLFLLASAGILGFWRCCAWHNGGGHTPLLGQLGCQALLFHVLLY